MNTNQLNTALNHGLTYVINHFAPAIIGILIVVWVISRQVRPRLVTDRMTVYYVLMAIGAVEILQGWKAGGLTASFLATFVIYSLVVPPIFGWLRVKTYRYWLSDGAKYKVDKQVVMRRGDWRTAALWVAYMALHLLLDHFLHAPGNLFLLFDIGFSLLVQRRLAWRDAGKEFPEEIKNNTGVKD